MQWNISRRMDFISKSIFIFAIGHFANQRADIFCFELIAIGIERFSNHFLLSFPYHRAAFHFFADCEFSGY